MIKRFRPFGMMRTTKLRRQSDGFALLVIMPFNNVSHGQIVTDILTYRINPDWTTTETSTRIKGRASASNLRSVINRHVEETIKLHLGVEMYLDLPKANLSTGDQPDNHTFLDDGMSREPHAEYVWPFVLGRRNEYRAGFTCVYPVTRRRMIPEFQGNAAR